MITHRFIPKRPACYLMLGFIALCLSAVSLWLYAEQLDDSDCGISSGDVEVVKATRSLRAGDPLTKDRITTVRVPRKFLLPPNPLLESELNIYLGTPVAVNVEEGAMVLTTDFGAGEGPPTFASNIPVEERAMALSVDEVSGLSGLLRPGDRVDVLGTLPTDAEELNTIALLQNVTLLAVGERIVDVPGGPYSTVTLSVTTEEAQLLTLAQTRGKLTLLLRNRADNEVSTIRRTRLDDVLADLLMIQGDK